MARGSSLVITEGFDELTKLLKQLPMELRRKALKSALRKGAEVIADEAKSRAPVDTGALRDSIKARPATRLRNKTAVGYRVVAGDDDYKGDQFYAAFIEYGFFKQPVRRVGNRIWSFPRGVGTPTWQPPRPFMRPSLESKRSQASKAIADAVKETIDNYFK
jgi:HK97 gp10 family phage protein